MKQFFVLISFFASLQILGQGYIIKTDISNSSDSVAYLGHHFANQRYVDDTTTVVEGHGEFSGNKELPEGIYFYYTPTIYFEFILDNPELSITSDANDVVNSTTIHGSNVNDGFYAMQKFTGNQRKSTTLIRQKLDSATEDSIKKQLTASLSMLSKEVKSFQKELQGKYPGTLLDGMIAIMQTPEIPKDIPDSVDKQLFDYLYYKDHFWDNIDPADSGLLRTPLIHDKIMDYLDNVIIQFPDSVIKAVDIILSKTVKSEEAFRYMLITLVNKYEVSPIMGFDEVFVHLVEKYYLTGKAPWTDDTTLTKLQDRIATIKPNFIGNPAPPLTLEDTLGTVWNLYDVQAKYTVLYFYDPDCGHCQQKTPILYESYPELKEKGVEILGICTTTDEKRWKEFIRKDDLAWINLADLSGQTHFRYFYDIRSTPTVYILDKDKKIVVKKIDALKIPEVIDNLIKNESFN